ncbi:hypothetical protein LLEC1_06514 [Akanthomyces lecanii]|uniref:Pyridoxamine 5'-phosphate oxidase N-terminal domain-containing protein n=1 Tax=Cordyceps confragosa TaxID=2714763 RepID=A0A179IAU8_CORDF|nr:hypothetical protein LLEC1_06514 [Akanthomyces lecanii]
MHPSYTALPDSLRDWALRQPVFFVASAPLRGRHVNLSPKGLPESSLAVLSPSQVAYVDSTGSGCETISHIRENGRVTLLFCSFDKVPRTLRLYCTGTVVEFDEAEYEDWLERMGGKNLVAARAVIVLHVFKVQLSCGFGVPLLALDPDPTLLDPKPCLQTRSRLQEYAQYTIDRGQLRGYQMKNNFESLDGLPGMHSALRDSGRSIWWAECKNWHSRNQHRLQLVQYGIVGLFAILILQTWPSDRHTPKV